jgi:cell pole-organizing protein PopZ
MEEILASIRKIISEDSGEPNPPAPPPQPAMSAAPPPPAPVQETDVLDLTHVVHEEPQPVVAAAPEPVVEAPTETIAPPVEASAPVETITPAEPVVVQSVEEASMSSAAIAAPAPDAQGDLVSHKTRQAIDDALSGLDLGPTETESVTPAPVAPIDGASIEAAFDRAVRETFDPVLNKWLHEQSDTIIERMKPAIREWMEDNLPSMMKAAIEAEVARAVKARTKR